MSTYNGRRGPNVSQYILELNTIPTPQEIAAQNQALNMDDDFTLFTNAEFLDFDNLDIPDLTQGVEYDPVQEERARRQNASAYRHSAVKSNEAMNGKFTVVIDLFAIRHCIGDFVFFKQMHYLSLCCLYLRFKIVARPFAREHMAPCAC
jgi:hypothetical protein